jgi:DNA-binding transcriptional regulator YhcF (GntR family)
MTTKQYRTAMGKVVDMGALMLRHENVRAVGNMSANARGDKLDSANRVIDRKSQQIKRQHKKQTASENLTPATSNAALRRTEQEEMKVDAADVFSDLPEDDELMAEVQESPVPQGGLAAAIAKAKTVQQTKLPTPREMAKSSGVRKI